MLDMLADCRREFEDFQFGAIDFTPMSVEPQRALAPRLGLDTQHQKVAGIRREMYSLKDEIKSLVSMLQTIQDFPCEGEVPGLESVIKCATSVVTVMDEILSNNVSEWIESGLDVRNKYLSYREFTDLDSAMLSDIAGKLGENKENLEEAGLNQSPSSDPLFQASYFPDLRMAILVYEGQLKEIESIMTLLHTLFTRGQQ